MKDKATPPTSAEITSRLRIVTELRNLCLSLGRTKRVGVNAQMLREQGVVWRADAPPR